MTEVTWTLEGEDDGRQQITLAGERMRIEEKPDGTTTIHFDDKGTGRVCGSCTLCCKLLPVPTIHKAAGEKCRHLTFAKRCTIYADRPLACRAWSCRWLADSATAGLPRPDRCHYVLDMELDTVQAKPHDGSPGLTWTVVQVWVDPAFPDAYQASELLGFLARMGEKHRWGAIIRYSSEEAFTLWPPTVCHDGQWHRVTGEIVSRTQLDRDILADAQRAKLEKRA